MGWNTSALLVRDRSADQALALLGGSGRFRPTSESVTADVASSHRLGPGRLAIAADQGWCWLWDPDQQYVPATYDLGGVASAATVLAGTRALTVLFGGASTIYGFWLHEDGELVRRVVCQDGWPVEEAGQPLPFESGLAPEDWSGGDALWQVITSVTGLTFQARQRFRVYERS